MNDVWRGWHLTEEQRLKMVEGDREALDRFYFENYDHLQGLAKHYAWKKFTEGFGDIYSSEELVQDLYLALPHLSYENQLYFLHTVHHWFYFVRYGGKLAKPTLSSEQIEGERKLLFIIDKPLHDDSDSDMRGIDKYRSYLDPYQELLRSREELRRDKLEADLEGFLKELQLL